MTQQMPRLRQVASSHIGQYPGSITAHLGDHWDHWDFGLNWPSVEVKSIYRNNPVGSNPACSGAYASTRSACNAFHRTRHISANQRQLIPLIRDVMWLNFWCHVDVVSIYISAPFLPGLIHGDSVLPPPARLSFKRPEVQLPTAHPWNWALVVPPRFLTQKPALRNPWAYHSQIRHLYQKNQERNRKEWNRERKDKKVRHVKNKVLSQDEGAKGFLFLPSISSIPYFPFPLLDFVSTFYRLLQ
jgi:hypothetical protein